MKKTTGILFALMLFLEIGVGYAATAVTQEVIPPVQIQFDSSVKKFDISPATATAIAKGEIDEHIDQKSSREVSYVSLSFWEFPLQVVVLEEKDRFFLNDAKKIEKGKISSEKISQNNWEIEVGWRIFPLICLFFFFIRKKSGDILSIVVGGAFSLVASSYLVWRLDWTRASMETYLASAACICLILAAARLALHTPPKEEEPLTLAKLRQARRPPPQKDELSIILSSLDGEIK